MSSLGRGLPLVKTVEKCEWRKKSRREKEVREDER